MAFSGNFYGTKIELGTNFFETFDAGVFGEVVKSMLDPYKIPEISGAVNMKFLFPSGKDWHKNPFGVTALKNFLLYMDGGSILQLRSHRLWEFFLSQLSTGMVG